MLLYIVTMVLSITFQVLEVELWSLDSDQHFHIYFLHRMLCSQRYYQDIQDSLNAAGLKGLTLLKDLINCMLVLVA